MLITNFTFDGALSQILYYHTTGDQNIISIAKRNINEALTYLTPKIVLGFNNIEYKPNDNFLIIDNTKLSEQAYSNYNYFLYCPKMSLTKCLYEYIQSDKQYLSFVNMAEVYFGFRETNDKNIRQMYDLYNTIGHNLFINRFLLNPTPVLNKNEQQLILRMNAYKDDLIENLYQHMISYKDGVCVVRSSFILQRNLETCIINHNEDVFLLCYWDYEQSGKIRVTLKSKNDLAGKIAEAFNGFNFICNGTFLLTYKNEMEDVSLFLLDTILNMISDIQQNKKIEYYEHIEKELNEEVENKNPFLDMFEGLL